MGHYRSHTKIIVEILSTTREMDSDGSGVGVTLLMDRCNVSYSRITRLLSQLVASGLMEVGGGRSSKYRIRENGLKFLQYQRQFDEFAESFGLRL